jgi:hypothetical protein
VNKSIARTLIVVGVVFLVIGSSSERAFLPVGLAFVAIGVVLKLREGRVR